MPTNYVIEVLIRDINNDKVIGRGSCGMETLTIVESGEASNIASKEALINTRIAAQTKVYGLVQKVH